MTELSPSEKQLAKKLAGFPDVIAAALKKATDKIADNSLSQRTNPMGLKEIPTLLHVETVIINADVCDTHQNLARVRFPDGGGQIITSLYKNDPGRLRELLFEWLSAHINAVRKEYHGETETESGEGEGDEGQAGQTYE